MKKLPDCYADYIDIEKWDDVLTKWIDELEESVTSRVEGRKSSISDILR
jgi:hypothetical protein